MTYCPHCSTDSATLRWQAERISELEEELRQAKRKRTPAGDIAPIDHYRSGLTQSEANILALLMRREIVTVEEVFAVIVHTHHGEDRKATRTFISKLRRKIESLGMTIGVVYGVGYYIPREQKAALTNLQPAAVNQNEWAHEPNAKTAAER